METVCGGDGVGDGGTSPCGMPVGDGDEMGSGRTGGEGGGETIDGPILICSAVRVAGRTIAKTAISMTVTFMSIAVALLALLVASAIFDSTEVAVAVGVRILASTMTLPDVTVTSTADGWMPAWAAIA